MGGSKLIESISKTLTNFFVRNGLIKEYDSEVYSYGFEMFVSEIISWLIIIPIAIISGEFLESMAFVFSFIILEHLAVAIMPIPIMDVYSALHLFIWLV